MPDLFAHQVVGRDRLKASRALLLGDEMRLGKTVQVIAGAEELFLAGELETVLVVAPAPARAVWADPDPTVGQIAKFATVPSSVLEYKSGKMNSWEIDARGRCSGRPALRYIVTNYELMRRKPRTEELLRACGPKTAVVFDESIALANYRSQQTRAAKRLRQASGYAWLLNGTPSGDSPEAIFGQFFVLDDRVLGKYISHFRARYAVMNPYVRGPAGNLVKVDKWINLDDLANRTAPLILRRTMDQVFDLPPKLDPVVHEVPLSKETWSRYEEMRRDALTFLEENRLVTASQAGTLAIRLAQLAAGFVSGVEDLDGEKFDEVRWIGTEKVDAIAAIVDSRLANDPDWKGLIWTRFRADAIAIEARLAETGRLRTKLLLGGQKKEIRADALRLLNPETAPEGPAALVGTEATGKYAFNFAASSDVLYASNDWSLMIRDQSEARVLGSRQTKSVLYTDVCAVGPKGQKTVDHTVVRALREKQSLAAMTAEEWKEELSR